jgi:uncharacterized protein YdaT
MWTKHEYPSDMRHLSERVREKAIEIANRLMSQGYQEAKAIPIAIAEAREWSRMTRERSPEFAVPRR